MDIRCGRCGEPWDLDSLHEEAETRFEGQFGQTRREMRGVLSEDLLPPYEPIHRAVREDFRRRGCAALFGATCNETPNRTAAIVADAFMDLAGEDLDGLANDLEDAEALGIL